jgi:DNA-binding GntR family transcriptional regulator
MRPNSGKKTAKAAELGQETPRYVQIFNTLARRLESGTYPVDMRLPTESELCDEFHASRFTVREALRRLVEQGMVQRRQGAASIVVSATPQARYVQSLSSLNDLFQFALDTRYELLSMGQVTLDEKTASGVGAKSGERWGMLQGIRRDETGGMVCRVHSYIAPRAVAHMRALRRCVGPFYAYLSERTGEEILEVEQDIFGTPMSAEVAASLDRPAGTVGICALRRYVCKKGTLIASYNWHIAETFYCRMTLSRSL